jgi:hypothetical protein
MSCNSVLQQEYDQINKKEEVTRIAKISINKICDFTRETIGSNFDNYTVYINAVNFIASTKIISFLLRENNKLVQCEYISLMK